MYNRMVAKAIPVAFVLLISMHAGSAWAWWDDGWAYRKQVNVDTSPTGLQTLQTHLEVPVLVRLHLGNFGYFADVLPNGEDLRFVASDDLTPLSYHIEKFDPVNQIAVIWLHVPQLSAGLNNQFVYMYYGNPEAVAGDTPAQSFDKNYSAVLHFNEPQAPRDSTAYGNHPLGSVIAEPNGIVGSGIRLSGQEYLQFNGSPTLTFLPDKGWTFSTWLKAEQPQSAGTLLEITDAVTARRVALTLEGALLKLTWQQGDQVSEDIAVTPLTLGSWQHVSLVLSAQEAQVLVGGTSAIQLQQSLTQLNGIVRVGNNALADAPLVGVLLDELRISNVARSEEWLSIGANSQNINSFLLLFGEDSQRDEAGSESHLVTTLRNVDWGGLEGIVIFVCMLMAMASWYVMVDKGLHIRRVRLQNSEFMQKYRESEDPSELAQSLSEQEVEDGSGTVVKLFHQGMFEINKRLPASVGAAASGLLSAESMSAIRATLTGQNVRISQQLNSLMVLLTLAIAGGPFLGLLGTVVGVMVTFAGIAASGDVNINAIAPGIAAALVATVAGLIVAIPALFGYNYISSRIKEVITENNVFVEEFMANATEQYQG